MTHRTQSILECLLWLHVAMSVIFSIEDMRLQRKQKQSDLDKVKDEEKKKELEEKLKNIHDNYETLVYYSNEKIAYTVLISMFICKHLFTFWYLRLEITGVFYSIKRLFKKK